MENNNRGNPGRNHSYKRTCCRDVKDVIRSRHVKCNKLKVPGVVNGKIINRFYGISSLKEEVNYQVCSNIAQQLNINVVPSCTKRKRDDVVDGTTIT